MTDALLSLPDIIMPLSCFCFSLCMTVWACVIVWGCNCLWILWEGFGYHSAFLASLVAARTGRSYCASIILDRYFLSVLGHDTRPWRAIDMSGDSVCYSFFF